MCLVGQKAANNKMQPSNFTVIKKSITFACFELNVTSCLDLRLGAPVFVHGIVWVFALVRSCHRGCLLKIQHAIRNIAGSHWARWVSRARAATSAFGAGPWTRPPKLFQCSMGLAELSLSVGEWRGWGGVGSARSSSGYRGGLSTSWWTLISV